jgi:hypothetical protein
MSGFDDEVDDAKKRLETAIEEDGPSYDDLAALQALAPLLQDKIKSRRLAFALTEDDDEDDQLAIAVVHTQTDDELGYVFVEGGEYVFESNVEGYFDDFVDEDPERFVARLYETLRADMAKYEVENKG